MAATSSHQSREEMIFCAGSAGASCCSIVTSAGENGAGDIGTGATRSGAATGCARAAQRFSTLQRLCGSTGAISTSSTGSQST